MRDTTKATYFWSGSNRAGEIVALAKNGREIGVAVDALDKGGRGLAELENLGADEPEDHSIEIVANVARNASGRPIVFFDRSRCGEIPAGDTEVEIAGRTVVVGFRKIAANVARALEGGKNILGDLLREVVGADAGERGKGHKVRLQLAAGGWKMTNAELEAHRLAGRKVFVDSGAFNEVKFDKTLGRFVDTRPITDADWLERLAAYKRIAKALGDRAYLVAPDKVGDQATTLERLARYRDQVRELRRLGANVIVPIQKGALAPADFDREVAATLGFDDYVRGIPSKKAAATVDEIGEFSRALPADARVHLLGLGPWGPRFDKAIEAVGRAPELVFCDACRLRSLIGEHNGRGGGPRILTALLAAARDFLGLRGAGKLDGDQSFAVKFLALDGYFATIDAR